VNLELYDTFGNLVATGTVGSDGRNESLSYRARVAGQYHIRVSTNPGQSGEYFLSAETPAPHAGVIRGEVYYDGNGNGTLDSGEPGLDNWVVDLYRNGVHVASQVSHAGGIFDFEGLSAGNYKVSEVLQSGWVHTAPVNPPTFNFTLTEGGVASGLDFGNFQTITISGEKFNDLNGDGYLEPGEPGLPGWTIQLVNSAGKVVGTSVTDANGTFSFANVGPSTYTVQERHKNGWVQTAPGAPGTFTVAAASGQNVSGLLFGNFHLVTFSGSVYNDHNGNGNMDPKDKGLKGWTVNLLDMNGNIVATTTSNGSGKYSFASIGPGLYTIAEIPQSGWYQTQPATPPTVYTIAASSGSNQTGLNFGNFQLVSISGEVFNDLNGNGHKDPGDPGLANWTVELRIPAGNVVASAVTDANGDYTFAGVYPGTFTLDEVLQSGWVQTDPAPPGIYTVTTSSGTNLTGKDFGNHFVGGSSPSFRSRSVGGGSSSPQASSSVGLATTQRAGAINIHQGVGQPSGVNVVYYGSTPNGNKMTALDQALGLTNATDQQAQEEAISVIAQALVTQKKPRVGSFSGTLDLGWT
jgi:protocatechuate 3,4-dioxygenase beta subunit